MTKEPEQTFSIGDNVLAKWPKSSLYYRGTVLDYNDVEYLIKFQDEGESEYPVKYSYVTYPDMMTSRSRSRGRTPPRKPKSQKSPARKGSKSPGRPRLSEKSSERKSPGRPKTSEKSTENKSPKTSPQKESSMSNSSSTTVVSRISTGTRQSARIAVKQTQMANNNIKVDARAIEKSVMDGKKLVNRCKSLIRRSAKGLWETSKVLPMMVVVLVLPLVLTQWCTKNKCSLMDIPEIPKRLHYYFDTKAIIAICSYVFALFLLTFVPLGKVIDAPSGVRVRCNAFISVVLTFAAIPALMKVDYNILMFYPLYRQVMTTCMVLGLLTAIGLYVKSFWVRKSQLNPEGRSGYHVADFVHGREALPTVWNFDIKFFVFRVVFHLMILLNMMVALKEFQMKGEKFSPQLLIACSFQIFHACDWMWFEEVYTTTFEYKKLGMGGYLSTAYLVFPFACAVIPRYVLNHGVSYPWYCLVAIVLVNIVGYIITRQADSQKHAFRTNPSNPALSHFESLPTSSGSRLLVSGWWGLVRHPNHLGTILMYFSWSLLCGFNHAFPWLLFVNMLAFILIRGYYVENACKRKYGLAWSSYCSRVKYRLIPKVF